MTRHSFNNNILSSRRKYSHREKLVHAMVVRVSSMIHPWFVLVIEHKRKNQGTHRKPPTRLTALKDTAWRLALHLHKNLYGSCTVSKRNESSLKHLSSPSQVTWFIFHYNGRETKWRFDRRLATRDESALVSFLTKMGMQFCSWCEIWVVRKMLALAGHRSDLQRVHTRFTGLLPKLL